MKKLTEEDVRRIFKEMLHEYETSLNGWCYRNGFDGLSSRYDAYQKHIDESLDTGTDERINHAKRIADLEKREE